jgi:predicted nucleotidyltransferase
MGRRWEVKERRAGSSPPVDRDQLVEAAEALAARHPAVDTVFLFGSRARGPVHPGSDVDLAVLLQPPVPASERVSTQEALARFLEDRLRVPVEVVLIHRDLSPSLLFGIFRVETSLYARDRERAHRVASQARNEYRDLLPRLERAFDRVRRRIEEWASAADRS